MTYAQVKTTGRGPIAWRLEIEGFPFCFVSMRGMEQTDGDGREWVVSLKMSDVKITQRADLPRAKVEASGITFTLADVGAQCTAAFNTAPTQITWLSSELSTSATTATVKSTSGFPTSGTIYVDSEVMTYTALGTAGTTFLGLTRGKWSTLGQTHYVPGGGFLRYPEVTTVATILEGRRVRLYAYSAGDDLTGAGTQLWLGIVRGEPRMQGAAWSILCDPISSVLDQEIGADLGEAATPRGIYLPPPGLWIYVGRNAASGNAPDFANEVAKVVGFWETQGEFIEAVNTALAADITGAWGAGAPALTCVGSMDGTYHFELVQGAGAQGVTMRIDGSLASEPIFENLTFTGNAEGPDAPVYPQLATVTYYCWPSRFPTAGAGLVPRGIFRRTPIITEADEAADLATYPTQRIYLGGGVGVPSNTTAAAITWQDGASSDERVYGVETTSASARSIDLIRRFGGYDLADDHVYTPDNLPTIRLGRSYNTTTGRGVLDLIDSLRVSSAAQVNTGSQPMIRSGDYNLGEWTTAYEGVGASASTRYYDSFKPGKLIEYVAPDLQLAGLYLAFDSDGALTLKRLRLASPTEVGVYQITRSKIGGKEWARYERGAVGIFNTVTIKDGYDALSGKWTEPTHVVRDVASYGRSPSARALTIEPKSTSRVPVTTGDAVRIAANVLGIYGNPYAYITVQVPLTALDVLLGDVVSVSTNMLPDSDGTRGVTDLVGIVTSREIRPMQGTITLTLLATTRRIAGYAPSALVASQTGATDDWTLTLTSSYFASGENAANHFAIGDRVQVYRFDSLTAGTLGGEVLTVSGYDVRVQFDSTWTPATDEWVLTYAVADDGNIQAEQRRYAYLADATGRIGWGDGTTSPAFTLAP